MAFRKPRTRIVSQKGFRILFSREEGKEWDEALHIACILRREVLPCIPITFWIA